jgi:hypothetical protein
MTNKTKFRLENLAIEGRVETPKINGIYVNKEIEGCWEKEYGDNTFCFKHKKIYPTCFCDEKEEIENNRCPCEDHTPDCGETFNWPCPPEIECLAYN